jgi:hypothetical protein
MDAVWLPVVWRGESLENALAAMEGMNRSGVLVEGDDSYDVVVKESVEYALKSGATMLAQVGRRDPVYVPEANAAPLVDLIRPLRTAGAYETLLAGVGRSYALVAHAYDVGLVVTRHEGVRKAVSQSNTYYCQGGPTTHYFPRPEVRVNEECPKCVGQPKGRIFLT